MQSLAVRKAASTLTAPATAAASDASCGSSPGPWARAASQAQTRACSATASIQALRCLTPWNWPIGRPNCSRTRA